MYKIDSGSKTVVQAVVVADYFDDEFKPITDTTPFSLIPLGNIPNLKYTLEFLALGGVEETFLVCSSEGKKIKDYVQKSCNERVPWSVSMKVNIILAETCRSFGDCLRELDAKGLIRGNFILIGPGTVGTIKLTNYLKRHVDTCKTDKNAVATLLFQNAGSKNSGNNKQITVGIDGNKRILFYQRSNSQKVEIPLEIINDNKTIDIYNSIKDVQIMICSISVLPLFTDNFDFQTRDDFVRGLLMNEEIMGSTIYLECIRDDEYGAGITNWRSYHSVNIDVMQRWVYPMTPDLVAGGLYRYVMNNIYRSQDVFIGDNVILVKNVVIGPETVVNTNTKICDSVIGPKVHVGKNVQIKNSFIFENVKIEDNVQINHSVIGKNCTIHRNSKLSMGSILGDDVVIPKDCNVEDALIESKKPTPDAKSLKIGDKAYKIVLEDTDSESGIGSKDTSRLHLNFSKDEISSDEESSVESDKDLSYRNSPIAEDDINMFLTEVMDSLSRGFEDKIQCDNLILEINSSRYAYNVSLKEVNLNVVKAILELAFQSLPCKQSTGLQYWNTLEPLLNYFKPILTNYIRNKNAVEDTLRAIEEVSQSNSEISDSVVKILEWLYDNDLMEEENIMEWNFQLDVKSKLYDKVKPFISWLQEAEEDSGSDDD